MKHVIFGESHGAVIGVTITGVPAGITLDEAFIAAQLARRAPRTDGLTTARREADVPRIVSGVFEGRTTGDPLTALFENADTRSRDYERLRDCPRPGHADFTGFVRSGGCNDYRGGGHFSGRLTAPLVFAGALAQLMLAPRGVQISAYISMIGGIENPTDAQYEAAVRAAKADGDSIGGAITCTIDSLPAGLGGCDYGCNLEGIIAQQVFAVPAVKGIEFGAGFRFAAMRGSEANDPFYFEGDTVATRTNHSGGINGGITNGMPVVFTVAIRPTPSISIPQETVNLRTGEAETLVVEGRHDPCIVARAVPVIEAAAALAACEALGIC